MSSVQFKGVSKSFGAVNVLKPMDLNINKSEFLVLVGPSGCGKSTALRIIAGLEEPTTGDVLIDGKVVNKVEPKDRDIGMVFQSYALYPHMNVYDNMAFGLRMRKVAEDEIKKRVDEASVLLKLDNYLQRKPKELSGGQRQRVALGRALVRKAKVFLFDEPLSNLDAKLRNEMRVEIKKLHQMLSTTTMVYVTHDQTEATTMGDRIAVLHEGQIQQIDTPTQIYHKPLNKFVAGFIGVPEMNFLKGDIVTQITKKSGEFILGVRPEQISLGIGDIKAQVEVVENLGAQSLAHLKLNDNSILRLITEKSLRPGQEVALSFDLTKVHLFDKNSGWRMDH